jgi:hypothetical protein
VPVRRCKVHDGGSSANEGERHVGARVDFQKDGLIIRRRCRRRRRRRSPRMLLQAPATLSPAERHNAPRDSEIEPADAVTPVRSLPRGP